MYVVVAGCGRVGAQLATMLSDDGHNVVVIDSNPDAFRRLGASFNGVTVVGNGFDEQVLEKAGIRDADVFIAVTDLDNTNIMAGQVAKRLFEVPRVVSRVYFPNREKTYHKLGLETVCGTSLVARRIRDWVSGRVFMSEVSLDANSYIAEFKAPPSMVGKRVADIEVPGRFRPVFIVRDGASSVPSADTKIAKGDLIIAAVDAGAVPVISDKYEVNMHVNTTGMSCPV